MFSILLPGDFYAWSDCPLGPQRFDYHDGVTNDCNGGVNDSIATGSPSVERSGVVPTLDRGELGVWLRLAPKRLDAIDGHFVFDCSCKKYPTVRSSRQPRETSFPRLR
jgi:hypothetical protein